jgi:hypothetical protein
MDKTPQWKQVLDMLMLNPDGVTTAMFCSTMGLASEYRRAISELRRANKQHPAYVINATRMREGCFNYTLGEIICNQ